MHFCIVLGSYYCYDNPGALQDIIKRDMEVNTATYMSLYAWYSWPNVVLCFFGGFLIDRVLGIRLGAILFAAFVTVGQVCSDCMCRTHNSYLGLIILLFSGFNLSM